LSLAKWAVGTSSARERQSNALCSPVTPAAALAWPRFPLIEPSEMKVPRDAAAAAPASEAASASVSARASMPSPMSVPVAWHSTYESDDAATPATPSAPLTAARWPATPGAA